MLRGGENIVVQYKITFFRKEKEHAELSCPGNLAYSKVQGVAALCNYNRSREPLARLEATRMHTSSTLPVVLSAQMTCRRPSSLCQKKMVRKAQRGGINFASRPLQSIVCSFR